VFLQVVDTAAEVAHTPSMVWPTWLRSMRSPSIRHPFPERKSREKASRTISRGVVPHLFAV
jgi:hypothetical protein